MSTTITPTTHSHQPADPTVAAWSCRVYEPECALHAAHQFGVDAWITAFGDKLHQALAEASRTPAPTAPAPSYSLRVSHRWSSMTCSAL